MYQVHCEVWAGTAATSSLVHSTEKQRNMCSTAFCQINWRAEKKRKASIFYSKWRIKSIKRGTAGYCPQIFPDVDTNECPAQVKTSKFPKDFPLIWVETSPPGLLSGLHLFCRFFFNQHFLYSIVWSCFPFPKSLLALTKEKSPGWAGSSHSETTAWHDKVCQDRAPFTESKVY